MTIDEIKSKKKPGDIKTAGEMIGITQGNAWVALHRPGSKHHERIVNVLTKIIEGREKIANEEQNL
ncbi:MAG: hypothetical protein JW857_11875 [Bacteroidales bacterium]|nr:hypothetical protein [Bacteroidales bacterium]MBN2747185.1 hypothetical protein [Bacteroidales bacterium]